MQICLLPIGLCDKIEKFIRGFIWGGANSKRTCSLVHCDVATQPKNLGGLGIRSLRNMNPTFMAKLCWKFLTEEDRLWVQVLKDKYKYIQKDSFNFKDKIASSNCWNGITRSSGIFEKGICSLVRNGATTSFWCDRWLGDEPFETYVMRDLSLVEYYCSVKDYCVPFEGWNNWSILDEILPDFILSKLTAFILMEDETLEDGLS